MTTADFDFPAIEAPPVTAPPAKPAAPVTVSQAAVAIVPLSIRDTVLAQFKEAEKGITELADKYRDVAYDVTTTKGMAEAKAARADLRDNGRLMLTNTEKRVKGEVNDLKRVMATEVERLVGIVQPVEDAVDAQIKAEEKRKAEEKAERERIAAERKAQFEEAIAKIRRYLALAQQPDMTADRIQRGIDMLAAQTYGAEWAEFAVPAANAQCETLEGMRQLHAAAVAREAEAARLEAQRIENERVAAELAEQQRQQADTAAALQRQADELEAQQAAVRAEADRLERERQDAVQKPQAEAQTTEAATFAAFADRMTGAIEQAQQTDEVVQVAGPTATEVQGAGETSDEAPAAAGVIANPPFTAPAPRTVTLSECQAVLSEALALCDELICKPSTKKQSAGLFARVADLRDRGGLPRATTGAAS